MSRDASEVMMNTVAEDTRVVVSVSHVLVVLLSVCIHKKNYHIPGILTVQYPIHDIILGTIPRVSIPLCTNFACHLVAKGTFHALIVRHLALVIIF